jgi:phospholipid/cholesterol/gamma-HCH transport system substrate-binding protein
MQKLNTQKIKLGLFIFIGSLLFLAAIFFIGNKKQLFNSSFHIKGMFKNVNGLKVADNIQFSGIVVGIVDGIEQITDTSVSVSMLIDASSRKFIKSDAHANIGSDGLMGNKLVIISPGTPTAKIISDFGTIRTSQPISMDDVMTQLNATSENAVEITEDLAAILKNIRAGKGTIGKIFMDTVFAENIDQTIVNLKQGAGGFDQNMKAASKNVLLRGFFKRKEKKETEKK